MLRDDCARWTSPPAMGRRFVAPPHQTAAEAAVAERLSSGWPGSRGPARPAHLSIRVAAVDGQRQQGHPAALPAADAALEQAPRAGPGRSPPCATGRTGRAPLNGAQPAWRPARTFVGRRRTASPLAPEPGALALGVAASPAPSPPRPGPGRSPTQDRQGLPVPRSASGRLPVPGSDQPAHLVHQPASNMARVRSRIRRSSPRWAIENRSAPGSEPGEPVLGPEPRNGGGGVDPSARMTRHVGTASAPAASGRSWSRRCRDSRQETSPPPPNRGTSGSEMSVNPWVAPDVEAGTTHHQHPPPRPVARRWPHPQRRPAWRRRPSARRWRPDDGDTGQQIWAGLGDPRVELPVDRLRVGADDPPPPAQPAPPPGRSCRAAGPAITVSSGVSIA